MGHQVCVHLVGFIPGVEVVAENWNESLTKFIAKVDDFNVRGQRDQISHPGFIVEYKFCPHCGQPIDRAALGLLSYCQAFEQHNAAKAAS